MSLFLKSVYICECSWNCIIAFVGNARASNYGTSDKYRLPRFFINDNNTCK